jgi:hypothetical protein
MYASAAPAVGLSNFGLSLDIPFPITPTSTTLSHLREFLFPRATPGFGKATTPGFGKATTGLQSLIIGHIKVASENSACAMTILESIAPCWIYAS